MICLFLITEEDAFRSSIITEEDIGKWMVETDNDHYICNNRKAADRLISELIDEEIEPMDIAK